MEFWDLQPPDPKPASLRDAEGGGGFATFEVARAWAWIGFSSCPVTCAVGP